MKAIKQTSLIQFYDPDNQIKWRKIEIEIYNLLQKINKPLTSNEISYLLNKNLLNIRPRLTEMTKKGYIMVAGKKQDYFTKKLMLCYITNKKNERGDKKWI